MEGGPGSFSLYSCPRTFISPASRVTVFTCCYHSSPIICLSPFPPLRALFSLEVRSSVITLCTARWSECAARVGGGVRRPRSPTEGVTSAVIVPGRVGLLARPPAVSHGALPPCNRWPPHLCKKPQYSWVVREGAEQLDVLCECLLSLC